mgnify:CR=1 FL=1
MIFITGTTGLVGAHLLEYLLSKNYEVKALIRKEEDKKVFKFDTKNVQWIVGDVLDINLIDEALKSLVNNKAHSKPNNSREVAV